jgi:hypothetical protein
MDLLLAKATLHPASKIEIGYDYDGFLAVADLTGDIKFEIPTDASIDMKLPELYFKEFRVSNRDPYFDGGVWEIRNLGLSMDFGGFGMDLSRISPYQGETSREMGLGFDLAISLGDTSLDLSAGGRFGILGELEEINERQKWKFKTIDLQGLFIDANIKDVVHVKGALQWYKDDQQYGKGFQGLLDAKFTKEPLDFSASVSAQFGKLEDTKYFFVDAMVGLGSGIPIGPLNINGFGGGISYHMNNRFNVGSMDFASTTPATGIPHIGKSFSGVEYFVDAQLGIGLKATVMVATQKKELFNGWAGLEFLFNDSEYGGGLARVSFKGQGQFMADVLPEPPEFLNELASNLEDALPIDVVPDLGIEGGLPLSAWIDLTYNFNDNVFDGKLEAYLNAGIIRGAGNNNALVQAAMHIDSEKWYFNVGTPTNPAGVLVNLPLIKSGATAYFNMGTDIPDFPGLPTNVAAMAGLYNNNEGLRKSGGGVMFGANMFMDAKVKLGPVEAFLNADLGFDLMLRDYGNATCANTNNRIGINGWYASGQAWIYLEGGVRFLGVPIFEAGLAGIMQARLPNPLWAKATLAAEVRTFIGKKRLNFNVEIGERCEFEDENGEEIPENPVINYLNPLDKAQGVAVDLIPEIYFNNVDIGEFGRRLNPDAILGDAARIGIGNLKPLVRMQAEVSNFYIRSLDALVNDRFPIAPVTGHCGTLSYQDAADFRYLRDAAGVSSSGSQQAVLIRAEQFDGADLSLDLSQAVRYLPIKESYKRYRAVRSQLATCVNALTVLHPSAIADEGVNTPLADFLEQNLGTQAVDFYNEDFPDAPDFNGTITVNYVLPNNITTTRSTIHVPK